MPFNIDDIKKLPNSEKLELIQELIKSLDKEMKDEEFFAEEDLALNDRLIAYEDGNVIYYSWKDVRSSLESKVKELRRVKG